MTYFHLSLSLFYLLMKDTAGYYSTVECPPYSETEILQYHQYDSSAVDCTLLMSCNSLFEISSNTATESPRCLGQDFFNDDSLFDCYPENDRTCTLKPKVTMIKNWDVQSIETGPCPNSQDSSVPSLLPIPGNCSLFYKCDWGSAVLFECPPQLHFNSELQICDWPWKARCDSSWTGCPRPYPQCPTNHSRALYLPHPHLCDKFYQCDWGTPHLQTCPTGLHFNPILKICDWPYKANCQVC